MTMHAEDIDVGDWIVILSWKPELIPLPCGELAPFRRNGSGDPLHVTAIDLPFFIVQFYGTPPYRMPIDTRRVNIRKVSPEYLKAFYPLGVPSIVYPS